MTSNSNRSFLCYGTLIHSNINFSEHLSGGGSVLCEAWLDEETNAPGMENWAFNQSLLTSHGREMVLHAQRVEDESGFAGVCAFEVQGVVTFSWASGTSRIRYSLAEEGDEQLLAFWFIHIFLPLYLSLEQGFDFLHAGSVVVGGRAVLFVAPSTGGKSTLTEYFLRRGHQLVTDDKLATFVENGLLTAVPAHGNYRPYRRSEDLGIRASEYAEGPLPVAAIYLLDRVEPEEDISFTEVRGFRKFDRLMPNYIFGFRHMKASRLAYLARLANVVPVYEVAVPHDLERLGEVYEAICSHTKKDS